MRPKSLSAEMILVPAGGREGLDVGAPDAESWAVGLEMGEGDLVDEALGGASPRSSTVTSTRLRSLLRTDRAPERDSSCVKCEARDRIQAHYGDVGSSRQEPPQRRCGRRGLNPPRQSPFSDGSVGVTPDRVAPPVACRARSMT